MISSSLIDCFCGVLVRYQGHEIIDAELVLVQERQDVVLEHSKFRYTLPCGAKH